MILDLCREISPTTIRTALGLLADGAQIPSPLRWSDRHTTLDRVEARAHSLLRDRIFLTSLWPTIQLIFDNTIDRPRWIARSILSFAILCALSEIAKDLYPQVIIAPQVPNYPGQLDLPFDPPPSTAAPQVTNDRTESQ